MNFLFSVLLVIIPIFSVQEGPSHVRNGYYNCEQICRCTDFECWPYKVRCTCSSDVVKIRAGSVNCKSSADCGGTTRGNCRVNGECDCYWPRTGPNCNICNSNQYAGECFQFCDMVINCSWNGRCSGQNGSCICFNGWAGRSCKIATLILNIPESKSSTVAPLITPGRTPFPHRWVLGLYLQNLHVCRS